MKKLLFTLLVFHFSFLILNAQWVQTNGPYGNGIIRCFAVSGNNIFGGSYSLGVFLSTNNGDTWAPTSLNNVAVLTMFANGTTIYAGTNFGAYRTTNNGQSWTFINDGLPVYGGQDVYTFALKGSNLYIGTDAGIYVSSNNGNNWNSLALTDKLVTALLVNGNNIFAGTWNNYSSDSAVMISTNNGLNWANAGLGHNNIKYLVSSGNNIFALTDVESSNLYLTTNNGQTWVQRGLSNFYLYCLAFSGTTLFAGTNEMQDNHIMRSNDYGANWISASNGLLSSSAIRSIAVNGSYLFAATEEISRNDVYRSTNNGDNWYLSNTGMCYKLVLSLASFGSNIFAGTYVGGVYYSSNNGNNWSAVNNGLPNKPIDVLASTGNYLYAGVGVIDNTGYGIFRTSDNGLNWYQTGLNDVQVTHLITNGNIIYAGGNSATTASRIFLSTDYGASWTSICSNYNDIVALAVTGSSIFAAFNTDSLYRSTNNGVNWVVVNNGIPSMYINAITTINNNILVGTGGNGIFLSTNNGNNWSPVNNGLPEAEYSSVLRFVTNGSYIFAGMGEAYQGTVKLIYLSTNNGVTWINKSQGMDTISVWVPSMLVANNYIFAGTDIQSGQGDFGTSVWRRSYNDIIGINKISELVPATYSLKQNYPNPFNPSTKIKFDIPKGVSPLGSRSSLLNPINRVGAGGMTVLKVYNILGKEISTLVNEKLQPGTYEITFNASQYPSGVYFYRLITDGYTDTKRMVLLK